jgi:hypothetical protein
MPESLTINNLILDQMSTGRSHYRFRQIKSYALYKNPAFDRACEKLLRPYKRIDSGPQNIKNLVLVPLFGINNDVVN